MHGQHPNSATKIGGNGFPRCGPLALSRRQFRRAVAALAEPLPVWDGGSARLLPPVYLRLRGALRGAPAGRRRSSQRGALSGLLGRHHTGWPGDVEGHRRDRHGPTGHHPAQPGVRGGPAAGDDQAQQGALHAHERKCSQAPED